MALEDSGKNIALDALVAVISHLSLHSAFPATIGPGNELAGGSPAYARQAVVWDAASGGAVAMNGTEVFDIESGDTVSAVGLTTALTSGSIHGGADLTDEVFGAQGTYTLTAITVTIT